ncbi:alpha/beta-hydrolase, partial [Caulochytrium protostelioides]
ILPNLDPGFDVCWIDLPDLAQGDIQMTGEFVAHAITLLALNSTATNGKLTVVSHSQGALDVQWALAFWPQTRGLVSAFVSLAGDFKGSLLATAGCKIVSLFNGGKGCTAATWQQATNSKFLQTLNNAAGLALVPTTSIRSLNDDVVVPQVGENASSVLPWASNVLLQDVKVCGPDQDVNHSEMRIDPGAFALAYEALYRASKAQGSRPFDQKYC